MERIIFYNGFKVLSLREGEKFWSPGRRTFHSGFQKTEQFCFGIKVLFHCFLGFVIVVRSLSGVQLLATPQTAARQASLSFTISQSLLKLMSIQSVMPSTHLILCHPFSSCPYSFPQSESFPMSCLFKSGGQSIGASASAPVLPMHIQGWFPLGLTGLISLQTKRLSGVFSSTKIRKHQFFDAQLSLWPNSHLYMTTGKTIALTIRTFVGKIMVEVIMRLIDEGTIAYFFHLNREKKWCLCNVTRNSLTIMMLIEIQQILFCCISSFWNLS